MKVLSSNRQSELHAQYAVAQVDSSVPKTNYSYWKALEEKLCLHLLPPKITQAQQVRLHNHSLKPTKSVTVPAVAIAVSPCYSETLSQLFDA